MLNFLESQWQRYWLCLNLLPLVLISGAARAGPESRPALGHSKLACVYASARTVWRAVGFRWVGNLQKWRKCITKKRNEVITKIDVVRVCEGLWSRNLDMRSSSVFDVFAGLHFENEPGLTELDAAESRRNRLSRRIRRSESVNLAFYRIPARWFMCPLISTSLRMSSALQRTHMFHGSSPHLSQ